MNPAQIGFIALVVLGLATLLQVIYLLFYFLRLARFKAGKGKAKGGEGVSVIIVARNEYKNLEANLQYFLEQDYPNYEVIVVNNGSWDSSQDLLETMELQYPHLKIVKIVEQERYPKGKKFGLTLGIKAASNEWVLLSDSDCKPADRHWISSMQSHFTDSKSIVLGYSPYEKKSGLLNLFIRFETFYTALQYMSFALAKQTYMGVGRNLAYRKSLFFSVKGFASHNHIISGDDDLFVNETATSSNVTVNLDPDSFIYSKPKDSFGAWYQQKRRHLNTGKFYSAKSKWKLALLNVSHLLFYPALALSIIYWPVYYIPLAIYGFRLILQLSIYGPIMHKTKDLQPLYFLPFLDLLYFFYYFIAGFATLFSRQKKKTW